MPIHLKYKLAEQANVSTRMAFVEDKNTEAQRTQSYPSHLLSVTSVSLCFKSTRPKGISIKTAQLQNQRVKLVMRFAKKQAALIIRKTKLANEPDY